MGKDLNPESPWSHKVLCAHEKSERVARKKFDLGGRVVENMSKAVQSQKSKYSAHMAGSADIFEEDGGSVLGVLINYAFILIVLVGFLLLLRRTSFGKDVMKKVMGDDTFMGPYHSSSRRAGSYVPPDMFGSSRVDNAEGL